MIACRWAVTTECRKLRGVTACAEGGGSLRVLRNCGTRRKTEVRTISWCNVLFLQLTTQTAETTVCAVQINCVKGIICFFIAPRTHARTHSQIPIRTVAHAALSPLDLLQRCFPRLTALRTDKFRTEQNRTALHKLLCSHTFWLRRTRTDPQSLDHVNIGCPEDWYPKLKVCISELIVDSCGYIQ
jgi:hypothetical protein